MSRSEVDIHEFQVRNTSLVHITARGGTRRERGAAIAATVRNYGKALRRYHIEYSETYGFQTATYTRYEIA